MHVFGITGWKNSGKTTLVAELIRWFGTQGYRVSSIKHAHCDFDIDKRGSDSYQHREAGAQEVIVSSNGRWALMHEIREAEEVEMDDLLKHLSPVDLVLVEGFKMGDQPKIQVVRPENNTEPLSADAQPIVAIASDSKAIEPKDYHCEGPLLSLNNVPEIGRFIEGYLQLKRNCE